MTIRDTIISLGLVPPDALRELRTWGAPVPAVGPSEPAPLEDAVNAIISAREKSENNETRVTAPDVLTRYRKGSRVGVLSYVHRTENSEKRVQDNIYFAFVDPRTVAFAWADEQHSLADLLLDVDTRLLVDGKSLAFRSAESVSYGNQLCFVVASYEEDKELT